MKEKAWMQLLFNAWFHQRPKPLTLQEELRRELALRDDLHQLGWTTALQSPDIDDKNAWLHWTFSNAMATACGDSGLAREETSKTGMAETSPLDRILQSLRFHANAF